MVSTDDRPISSYRNVLQYSMNKKRYTRVIERNQEQSVQFKQSWDLNAERQRVNTTDALVQHTDAKFRDRYSPLLIHPLVK